MSHEFPARFERRFGNSWIAFSDGAIDGKCHPGIEALKAEVDTLIIMGGSTSGCIRATAVDSLSRGYRTIVPEECVADKHEIPHFANLADLMLKYADVVPVTEVFEFLDAYQPAND